MSAIAADDFARPVLGMIPAEGRRVGEVGRWETFERHVLDWYGYDSPDSRLSRLA